jgi:FkbM family methyltransferase
VTANVPDPEDGSKQPNARRPRFAIRQLKRLAAKFPKLLQQELRRVYFGSQIRRNTFATDEKEFALLNSILAPGDWVLDIGANVGHYTNRMSELVGVRGRVIAFEPVPDTFALLAANAQLFKYRNVSLLNVAASDRTGGVGINIPEFSEGLANYYQASVISESSGLQVLTVAIDGLMLPAGIRLAKIDVEGHELAVICGMRQLLERDHPTLIVETSSRETLSLLEELGYVNERLPGSSNVVCRATR